MDVSPARLRPVRTTARRFSEYRPYVHDRQWDDIHELAKELSGLRVLQINSTSKGGGVAELLRSGIPLLRDLGIHCEWKVLSAPPEFFHVTRMLHDGLQSAPVTPTDADWATYDRVNHEAAPDIDADEWDLIVVHDPQPLALRDHVEDGTARWLWRCHIDSSTPAPAVGPPLRRLVKEYDASIFTMPQYAMGASGQGQHFILPGIDPLTEKNRPMSMDEATTVLERYGLDPERPVAVQVSRFDTWKDPTGVIDAVAAARSRGADLQLALVGETADDDANGSSVLAAVREKAGSQEDVHIIADRATDRDVNAFQTAALVSLQKSLREGFGLTVSEALWSGTPVIGGAVGGIPQQIEHGRTGFLVTSVEETSFWLAELARDPERAEEMGRAGRAHVQQRFLLPRVLRDEMRVWSLLLEMTKSG